MDPAQRKAIAEYLEDGGKVRKIQEAIPASEPEVLHYLATCGIDVKYFPDGTKPYSYQNKYFSPAGLVLFANRHRRQRRLPPFVLRLGGHR